MALRPIAITGLQPEERLLFACLKQDMSETEARGLATVFENDPIVWEVVFSIAYVQGVAPLVYTNLKKCTDQGLSVPAETLEKFELNTLAAKNLHAHRNGKLKDILQLISNSGEDVMLLKGAAYDAVVFQGPALTIPGDVDLLVKCGADRFSEQQRQHIYNLNRTESFEICYQGHHDLDLNQMLLLDYQQIWRDARPVELFGATVYVMGPEDLLIFACVNSGRKRFFHLKALFNISEIVGAYPKIDWNVVAAKARLYKCERMVFAALLAASCTVGSPIPGNLAALFKIGFLRLALIRYLVANMSYSDLADRTLYLKGGAAVTRLTDKSKWNRSGLLLLGVYSSGQFLKRLRDLLRH